MHTNECPGDVAVAALSARWVQFTKVRGTIAYRRKSVEILHQQHKTAAEEEAAKRRAERDAHDARMRQRAKELKEAEERRVAALKEESQQQQAQRTQAEEKRRAALKASQERARLEKKRLIEETRLELKREVRCLREPEPVDLLCTIRIPHRRCTSRAVCAPLVFLCQK